MSAVRSWRWHLRNYKRKMERYRLNQNRYKELKAYCRKGPSPEISQALKMTCDDCLSDWIERHVCMSTWPLKRMRAAGLPCTDDTFRVYRARFYYNLDRVLSRNGANFKSKG